MKDADKANKSGRLEFTARLYAASGGFVCLDLPEDSGTTLGSRRRVPIVGSLNNYPIQTSVFPTGEGSHFMLVNKEMQRGAGVRVGDPVKVVLQLDTSPRKAEVPADLRGALSRSKEAKEAFESLSYSHQKEYGSWIEEAKRPETRARRIERTLARLIDERRKKGSK
ncbi:MAG: YdeI/OmpD-associated family protein [Nitrososphaerales archaeon]